MGAISSHAKNLSIVSDRLVLRPLKDGDLPRVLEITKDNLELARYLKWTPPKDIAEARKTFCRKLKGSLRWGIFLGEEFAGSLSLFNIQRDIGRRKMDSAEMGFWINPELRGQGIATEAAKALLGFAFSVFGLRKVLISCVPENTASEKVIQKLQFRFVGTRKDHYLEFGRWWDMNLYEITLPEYLSQRII